MDIEDRDLVGVEYPGCVKNVDNMIKTLGGLTNISKVVCIKQSEITDKLQIVLLSLAMTLLFV